MNLVEDKMVFLVLCVLIRMVEGNGRAMQSVSAASILMKSAPEGSANRMAVSLSSSIWLRQARNCWFDFTSSLKYKFLHHWPFG